MWPILGKKVDLQAPSPLLDPVHCGCTQREAQVNRRKVMEKQKLFTIFITASTDVWSDESNKEELIARSYDMQGHSSKMCCALLRLGAQKKTISSSHLVLTIIKYNRRLENCWLVIRDMDILNVWSYELQSHAQSVYSADANCRTKQTTNSESLHTWYWRSSNEARICGNSRRIIGDIFLQLYWNSSNSIAIDDQFYSRQWTIWYDQSQNGTEHVTKDSQDWSAT